MGEIIILTSAMGLGTYVPAMHLYHYFINENRCCSISLVETYFSKATMNKYLSNKDHYHKNFKAAKLGHIIMKHKLSNLLDEETVLRIHKEWEGSGIDTFIVFSGNWMPILRRYEKKRKVMAVKMDVGITPSWHHVHGQNDWFEEINIYHKDEVCYYFETPVRIEDKQQKQGGIPSVYIHGGGWGMGDYQSLYQSFSKKIPYKVKTTIHNIEERKHFDDWEFYYLNMDLESWKNEELKKNELYPKMFQVTKTDIIRCDNKNHQGVYQLFTDCMAIISKPGGGTLMDSLLTGVPLVFLDSIAKHEDENRELWLSLGFGITYSNWEKAGFSQDILRKMSGNIKQYKKDLLGIGYYLNTKI